MSRTNLTLFNKNGDQRQRSQKKYRNNCSKEEWDAYQRLKNKERTDKYRSKQKPGSVGDK